MSPNHPKNNGSSTAPIFSSVLQNDHLPNKDETLVEMFRRICLNPSLRDRVVLRDFGREWTLGQLDEITENLAKLFVQRYACRVGNCVAIYMNKCAEYVFAYIAALKAGAAYLPLDISYPQSLLTSVLDEATPAVVCTSPMHSANLPAGTISLILDEHGEWMGDLMSDTTIQQTPLPDEESLTADDLAYLVYSSGTTGKPKGIQCPHRGAVISYKWRFRNFPYKEDDVEACNVFFVWEMFRPILQAIPMVIIPDSVIYDPAKLCQFLAHHRITRMLFTPSLLEMLLDTQEEATLAKAFEHMRLVHLCGEVVTCALLDRFIRHFPTVRCINLYSISETHDVAVADLNEFHSRQEKRQFAPVGRVIEGVKVLILDGKTMRRVPIGVPGEIYVTGPTLAIGYLNRPELNVERFVQIPEEYRREIGSERMYRTGDWGYLLPNSVLEICGRCDTTVRIRGYSVELQAIEAALLNLVMVRSCVVVSIGAEGEDKQLAAYIVLRDKTVTRKQLRAQLKRVLPFYMMPQFFIFLDKLPLLAASSKIDKKALPSVNFSRDVVETEAVAQTGTEKELAKIWMEILHLGNANLDIQESFFDLGGHSLLAARLLAKINNKFHSALTIRDLFNAPTIYAMARILDGSERVSPEHTVDLEQQVEAHDLKENVMDLHLRAFWRATAEWKKRFEGANVFLTGVTGYLGSHLLAELLNSSKTRITCLVRESSTGAESIEQRLIGTMRKNGLLGPVGSQKEKEQHFWDRVRVVAGDIALVHFGLSDEDYHILSYDIDVVLHAAAYVNLIYPYQALHGCNVIGTRNVIDFCLNNKLKPLHYISTDAVFPSGLDEIDECAPPEKFSNGLNDGYGQTKYVAEQLVLRARDRGLPTVIYRLGNQSAPTNGQHWNEQDFTYLMLLAAARLENYPNLGWEVELTPVDFTARFIVRILSELFCENAGKIFHLIGTKNAQWAEWMDWLRAFGFQMEQSETREWIKLVESRQEENGKSGNLQQHQKQWQQLQKLLHGITMDNKLEFTQSHFLRSNTDKVICQLGWEYPQINEPQFRQWIQRLIDRQLIEHPASEMNKMLAGSVCIVTGASEGIGEAIVKVLAKETNAIVVLASRQIKTLEAIVNRLCELGISAERFMEIKCDITNRSEVEELVRKTIEKFGKIEVLVNCAGLMFYTMAKRGYTEEWAKQIDVNVHGTTNVIGAVLPHMTARKTGHILTITSDAGKRAFPGLAVYSGTKFYLEGFIQALRQELVGDGIKFTNIQPGDVATKLASRSTDEEARQKYDGSEAGHRILDPEDVAKAVLFALSQPQHVAINDLLIEPQAAPI